MFPKFYVKLHCRPGVVAPLGGSYLIALSTLDSVAIFWSPVFGDEGRLSFKFFQARFLVSELRRSGYNVIMFPVIFDKLILHLRQRILELKSDPWHRK